MTGPEAKAESETREFQPGQLVRLLRHENGWIWVPYIITGGKVEDPQSRNKGSFPAYGFTWGKESRYLINPNSALVITEDEYERMSEPDTGWPTKEAKKWAEKIWTTVASLGSFGHSLSIFDLKSSFVLTQHLLRKEQSEMKDTLTEYFRGSRI